MPIRYNFSNTKISCLDINSPMPFPICIISLIEYRRSSYQMPIKLFLEGLIIGCIHQGL